MGTTKTNGDLLLPAFSALIIDGFNAYGYYSKTSFFLKLTNDFRLIHYPLHLELVNSVILGFCSKRYTFRNLYI